MSLFECGICQRPTIHKSMKICMHTTSILNLIVLTLLQKKRKLQLVVNVVQEKDLMFL